MDFVIASLRSQTRLHSTLLARACPAASVGDADVGADAGVGSDAGAGGGARVGAGCVFLASAGAATYVVASACVGAGGWLVGWLSGWFAGCLVVGFRV